jgi:hypothetical protein
MIPAVCLGLFVQASLLTGTHSHNDYERPRPLFDALDSGLNSVEVDVYLVDGKLLVGHDRKDLKPEKTLESLYLDPLAKMIEQSGRIYPNGILWVLVDIKSDGDAVYPKFKQILEDYPKLKGGADGPVRFVISGDRPIAAILADHGRYAGLDGRWSDLGKDIPADEMPWISEAWSSHFKWDGKGDAQGEEAEKLKSMATKVHAQGRMLRFWGAADNKAMWNFQKDHGVDLLNTDQPAALRAWLLSGSR